MYNESNIDLGNFKDFSTVMAPKMLSGDERILESIINDLAPYDIYDVISRVSALNLLIENQNKSLILDVLIAGILTRPRDGYQGTAKMISGKFRRIINRLETTGLRMMVDPAENPFIERIRYYGNYWIFPGINYSPAYTLQGFLNVLCLREIEFNDDFARKAHQLLNFVLYISDAAAKNLGYGMETIKHVEQTAIRFPDSQLSNRLSNCVRIPCALIEGLIDDEEVRQRLFIDFGDRVLSQVVSGVFQEFFEHPFLKVDEYTAIVLNPSVLIPFAIHHLVLLADLYGEKELLIDSYNREIWGECKQD
ncbi:MAG: hypothetical protein IJW77_10140 [Clostridia bacterium]|nr:hypothetical protein [Clostridia bacterium]